MQRVDYSIIKKKYESIGKGKVRLTQSTLLLIKQISATTTTYNFDVLESQNQGVLPEEIRLNLNDEFIVTEIGYYLKGELNSERGRSNFKLFTTPPIELATDFAALNDAYAGQLKILVNNINFIDRWDLQKHQKVARQQYANFATPNQASLAEFASERDGMYNCSPMITLSGAKKNDIQTVLPYAITAQSNQLVCDDGQKIDIKINALCVLFRGFLAQNGAAFQK